MILRRYLTRRHSEALDLTPRRASVVINTLNRRHHLSQVLDALHDQSFKEFEVVVVNGPSGDGTKEMLKRRRDDFHDVTCSVANLGVSRNIGVRAASSEFIAFIDDDAIPHPDWLARIMSHFADHNIAAVGGPVFDVPTGRVEWRICTSSRLGAVTTDSAPPITQYLGRQSDPFVYLAGCNMAFSRNSIVSVGGFDERLRYGYDDVDICAKIIDLGLGVVYDDEIIVNHLRAPSFVRNHKQEITDPYDLGFSRALFARTYGVNHYTDAQIEESLDIWVNEWVGGQSENTAYFKQRLLQGLVDASLVINGSSRASFPADERLVFRKFQLGRPRG